MKVKNVIKGLLQQYKLEELNVISLEEDKVIYSGAVDGWKATDIDMILYKREIENREVAKRLVFNNRKAFIFI